MANERNSLPGSPPKALIAKVRACLSRVIHCKPPKGSSLWVDVWAWASVIRDKNNFFVTVRRGNKGWPSAHEIASQYLWLGLDEMRASGDLRLPYRAKESITPRIAERLAWHARLDAATAEGRARGGLLPADLQDTAMPLLALEEVSS